MSWQLTSRWHICPQSSSVARWSLRYPRRQSYGHCGPSHLSASSACADEAAEVAAKRKNKIHWNHLKLIISSTLPSIHSVLLIRSVRTSYLLHAIAHQLTWMDPRKIVLLSKRLPVSIKRFDALCFANSFGNIDVEMWRSQPRHTNSSWFFSPSPQSFHLLLWKWCWTDFVSAGVSIPAQEFQLLQPLHWRRH